MFKKFFSLFNKNDEIKIKYDDKEYRELWEFIKDQGSDITYEDFQKFKTEYSAIIQSNITIVDIPVKPQQLKFYVLARCHSFTISNSLIYANDAYQNYSIDQYNLYIHLKGTGVSLEEYLEINRKVDPDLPVEEYGKTKKLMRVGVAVEIYSAYYMKNSKQHGYENIDLEYLILQNYISVDEFSSYVVNYINLLSFEQFMMYLRLRQPELAMRDFFEYCSGPSNVMTLQDYMQLLKNKNTSDIELQSPSITSRPTEQDPIETTIEVSDESEKKSTAKCDSVLEDSIFTNEDETELYLPDVADEETNTLIEYTNNKESSEEDQVIVNLYSELNVNPDIKESQPSKDLEKTDAYSFYDFGEKEERSLKKEYSSGFYIPTILSHKVYYWKSEEILLFEQDYSFASVRFIASLNINDVSFLVDRRYLIASEDSKRYRFQFDSYNTQLLLRAIDGEYGSVRENIEFAFGCSDGIEILKSLCRDYAIFYTTLPN